MQATAQRDEHVSSVSLDLNPPVRAESIDLHVLIGHRTATQDSASVESIADTFKTGSVNFVAVLEGQRLLGMCSRQETAALLGGRYGFSLWARKPIRNHLCKQETRIKVATPIGDVLRTVFARPDANFYDDVLLVDETGGFIGFIGTETLFKVQNALLLTNIREIEERDREIRQKNEQMETICEWRRNCSRRSCRARIRLFLQTPPRAQRSSGFVTVICRRRRWAAISFISHGSATIRLPFVFAM